MLGNLRAKMTDLEARILLSMLLHARSAWDIHDFAMASYGIDFQKANQDRRAYVGEKFQWWHRCPLLAFSRLDPGNQNRFILYLIKTEGRKTL